MKQLCPICNRDVDKELFDYHFQTEEHLLNKIRERYPAWVESPQKVLWFYRRFVLEVSQ
ncbi:MAG: hypothetical protein H3C47_00085 [Candidatus Cloacimonetes bacterium]|nr:hypothetical protein [Candidatus Cloacimonadota bacterium]